MLCKQFGEQCHGILLILRGTVIVLKSERAHKVVFYTGLFLSSRCSGTYGYVTIYLPRVGIEYGATILFSQLQGISRLAHPRRTDYYL